MASNGFTIKSRHVMMVASVVLALLVGFTHFGQLYPDSPGYLAVAYSFEGKGQVEPFRLLRPIVPFLASVLNILTDMRTAFALVNIAFWCCAVVLMIQFTEKLTSRRNIGFLASGFLTASVPMLIFGAAVLTDMAGYMFVLSGCIFIVNWDLFKDDFRRLAIAILVVSLGLLARETVIGVLFVAIAWVALSRGSWRRLAALLMVPISVAVAWSMVVGVSYWDWALANAAFASRHQSMSAFTKVWTWLWTIRLAFRPEIVILAVLGFLRLRDRLQIKKVLAILLGLSAFLLIAPGVVDYRYTFMMFPAVLPVAAVGAEEVTKCVARWIPVSDSRRALLARILQVSLLALYLIDTSLVTMKFISYPWKPYVDPALSGNVIQ